MSDWIRRVLEAWENGIEKGDFTPPGNGYSPVPGSKVGLFRKRDGNRWRYKYGKPSSAPKSAEDVAADTAEFESAVTYLERNRGQGGLADIPASKQLEIVAATLPAHVKSLPAFRALLTEVAGPDGITGARVKAVRSAVNKVAKKHKDAKKENKPSRYPDASALQDLTGGRVILKSNTEVYRAVAEIKKQLDIVEEDDYIATPKDGGYRSIHLIVKHEGVEKELQIRTENQHIFAEFCHDVYKPITADQKAYMASASKAKEALAYAEKFATFLAARDAGEKAPKKPVAPPGLLALFPHFERTGGSRERKTPRAEKAFKKT